MKISFLQFTYTRYNSIPKNVFGQNKFAKIYLGGRHLIELCVHVCMCTIELNSQIELWMGWTFMFFFMGAWFGLLYLQLCARKYESEQMYFLCEARENCNFYLFLTKHFGRVDFFLYPAFYIYGNYKKNIYQRNQRLPSVTKNHQSNK